MTYEQTIARLEATDLSKCFPIFIPSVLRPAHFLHRGTIQNLPKVVKEKVIYVVRESQLAEYKKAQPLSTFAVIPESMCVNGFGADSTRQFIFDFAVDHGIDHYFDIDDDLIDIGMCYQTERTTRRLRKEDRVRYAGHILSLASELSSDLFERHPNLCLGGFARITPTTCQLDYGNDKAIINGMSIPRALNIVNVKARQRLGVYRNGSFDKQLEDLGIVCNIIEHGGDVFKLPCFLFDVPTHEANPRTEVLMQKESPVALWKSGEAALKQYRAFKYVTYTSQAHVDNIKRPVSVSWIKIHADRGTKTIVEEW